MRPMHVLRVSGLCECVAGHFNMPNGYNFIGYGHYHWMLKSDVTSHYHNRSRTILIRCLIMGATVLCTRNIHLAKAELICSSQTVFCLLGKNLRL